MRGYTGQVLIVDLTTCTGQVETVPDAVYEQVLSGIGLGAYILYGRIPPNADPLGPKNILGFVAGILAGTGAMFSGRWMVVGKSPLTGGWGDANCGGNFAPAIKGCGYDGIFFTGAASEPVYLYADGSTVEIRPAGDLWGKDAIETEEILIERIGRKARVVCIGPAGERLSRIAGIANDRGRLAARSGLGAVMGSKNLKAVVLAGSTPVQTAKPEEIRRLNKQVAALMPKGVPNLRREFFAIAGWMMGRSRTVLRLDGLMRLPSFRRWGTTVGNEVCVLTGDAPVRNWRGVSRMYKARSVGGENMIRSEKKKYHCFACPLGCGGINLVNGSSAEAHRPEYETSTAFGALLLNHDLDSIFAINDALNRAGMDTISAGTAVAFAIDCFENGLLTLHDTGSLELRWGSTPAILKLVEMMILRQGIGDLLADGVQLAAARIGKGSERYAVHAGGQELPMHDPRQDPAYGVYYVADPTPGRHTIGSTTEYDNLRLWTKVSWAPGVPAAYSKQSLYQVSEENALKQASCGMVKMVIDGCGLCSFGASIGVDRLGIFEYIDAATGWDKTPDEYMETGRRIQSLRQGFNIRQGIEPASVSVNPIVYGQPPLGSGLLKGKQFDLYAMRHAYWKALGWDTETGHPNGLGEHREG